MTELYAGQVQMLKEAGITIEEYQNAIVSVEEFCTLVRRPKWVYCTSCETQINSQTGERKPEWGSP